MTTFSFKDVDDAYGRVKSLILKTPLVSNEEINKITKANVFFKLENLQWTGSFKLRGASNKIDQLTKNEKNKGVVAYSSGNHAQAVAYASKLNNISSTIVMPKNAPSIKINNTKRYGSEVVLYDPASGVREDIANDIARTTKKTIIKPYDDLDIIAGQGTAGKEIAEELLDQNIRPDVYLCCCGGGGLIAGTSTYLKHKFPNIEIYSVEPEEFNDTQLSFRSNFITPIKKGAQSICDALLAPQPGDITFAINQQTLTDGLTVSDKEVKSTIVVLAENLKIITEPGGAVAASALLNKKLDVENKTIIVMISGGNIDGELFSSIAKEK